MRLTVAFNPETEAGILFEVEIARTFKCVRDARPGAARLRRAVGRNDQQMLAGNFFRRSPVARRW